MEPSSDPLNPPQATIPPTLGPNVYAEAILTHQEPYADTAQGHAAAQSVIENLPGMQNDEMSGFPPL